MNRQERVQKVEAFNIDLQAVGIMGRVKYGDIFADHHPSDRSENFSTYALSQLYRVWDLMDARIPRKEMHDLKNKLCVVENMLQKYLPSHSIACKQYGPLANCERCQCDKELKT